MQHITEESTHAFTHLRAPITDPEEWLDNLCRIAILGAIEVFVIQKDPSHREQIQACAVPMPDGGTLFIRPLAHTSSIALADMLAERIGQADRPVHLHGTPHSERGQFTITNEVGTCTIRVAYTERPPGAHLSALAPLKLTFAHPNQTT